MDRKYKIQQQFEPHECEITAQAQKPGNLFVFDNVRAKAFGYNGTHSLYRAVSQNVFIPDVQTPTFALIAKDDPITQFKFAPIEDMQRNPNFIVAVTESGGHCDFLFDSYDHDQKKKIYAHYVPQVILEYFDKV